MKLYTYSIREYTQEQVILMVSKFSLLSREIVKRASMGATDELFMIVKAVDFVENL
jgi:hypothetical protein